MSETTHPYLEVIQPGGGKQRIALAGGRLIIGRAADATVRLNSGTISRQHAELFADPFGRWWVRDLGSRNGTRVNGHVTEERLLETGDTIQVEDFLIRVHGLATVAPRRPATSAVSVTISDAPLPGRITRLQDIEPTKIDAQHLARLTEFSSRLLNTEDDQERLALFGRLLLAEEFHGHSAILLRVLREPGDDAGADAPQVLWGPESALDWQGGDMPYISRTILRSVRETGAPVIASNVGTGTGVMELSLAGNVQEMAALACPFHVDEQTMDLLYLTLPAQCGTGEWLALAALAAEQFRQAETAWEARRRAQQQAVIERELEQASAIQMRLVPHKVSVPGVEAAIGFEPCRWVGGDYIDVVPAQDGRVFLAVADVCGKGMQAALITASLHTMVHTNVQAGVQLGNLMQRLNDYLCATLPEESFVTMIGMLLDTRSGEVEVANAGHPPATIIDRGGKVRELQSAANPPLGFTPGGLLCDRAALAEGELLALFTDGLSELTVDEGDVMLGIRGVQEYLKQIYTAGNGLSLAQLGADLTRRLNQFQGRAMPQDDRTFLLVRRA